MKYLSTKRNLNTNKDYYEVEKIITRKTFGKNRMYLIKWLGYPLKDCSWEPISNLSSISDMVENFDQNFPHSVDKRQLKKYLYIIKHRESHIIRIKNPFLEKRVFKKEKIKHKNDVIIYIDNSKNNIEFEEEKKEKKEIEIEFQSNLTEMKKEEETVNLNEKENNDVLNISFSDDKKSLKLIKPIIIW